MEEECKMKKLYKVNIELKQEGYSLYRMEIERILNTLPDSWEMVSGSPWGSNVYTLEIQILTTFDWIVRLKKDIKQELGIEIEGDLQ